MIVFWIVTRYFLFEQCPRSRRLFAVMRDLANAQPLPQKAKGDKPPWTEETGCPSFTPSDVGSRHINLSRIRSSTRVWTRAWNEKDIGNVYACTRSDTTKNDRELCVNFGTSKCRGGQ